MVPNLSKAGTSFKGAFAYYTHDKGRTDTGERMEWVSTRNLVTDDVARAERIMIATALDADRLKQEAGVRNTGRKSTAHVQTLSLSWSPDERVSREEMERAADEVISRLGLEDHQAVVLAHNDTAHQHVHVIINRVNPADGRMATLSNSHRELDRWAHEYEQRRGRIVTPKRHEKFKRREAARQRYTPEQRRAYAERKRAEATKKGEAQTAKETRNQRAILAARQADMKHRHSAQWAELNQRHRDQRNGDYQAYRHRVADERKRHDEARTASAGQRKAEWRDHYKAVRSAEKARQRLEKSPTGLLALAITAAREERRHGATESLARLTWANLISRERREAVYSAAVERDKAALVARQNFARDKALEHLSERRGQEIEARRSQQQEERDSLKREQAAERGEIHDQWQQLNERRDRLKGLHERTQQREKEPHYMARERDQITGSDGKKRGAELNRPGEGVENERGALKTNNERSRGEETLNEARLMREEKAADAAYNRRYSELINEKKQKDRAEDQGRQKAHSARKKELDAQGRHNQSVRKGDADHREKSGREAMDARAEKGRESTKERLERLSQGKPERSMEERRANLERLKQPKERQPRDRLKDQDRDR